MRPNILFIMADDHAAKAIGAYGSGLNETPSIDRLAHEGMRLDHCYVTNSICTPSRAAILTGTHNHVNGVTTLDTWLDNRLAERREASARRRLSARRCSASGIWGKEAGTSRRASMAGPSCRDRESITIRPSSTPDGRAARTRLCHRHHHRQVPRLAEGARPRRPFFLMCHHKAPHRSFAPDAEARGSVRGSDDPRAGELRRRLPQPRARRAEARMRVRVDMTYEDLGLVQPEGGAVFWRSRIPAARSRARCRRSRGSAGCVLRDRNSGEELHLRDRGRARRGSSTSATSSAICAPSPRSTRTSGGCWTSSTRAGSHATRW